MIYLAIIKIYKVDDNDEQYFGRISNCFEKEEKGNYLGLENK